MIQWMLAIWSLVPLPLRNPACIFGSSWFTYCWSIAWRILSISLVAHKMSPIVKYFEHSLALPFFGMKTDLYQSYSNRTNSPGHCQVFQICWYIEYSTLIASSFRILNSSARILSSLLALLVVMLPKAYLTLHLWISGSRWVTTLSWLSGSLRPFMHRSSVCSRHLFLISFVSVRSLLFLSFIEPILAWNVPLISPIFLKRSVVFPILLFSSLSLHCSLRRPFYFTCYPLELCTPLGISFPFSLILWFSSFLS